MNGVLVKMANGDNESFKTATTFQLDRTLRMDGNTGWLYVMQGDAELGVFPPGSWAGVRYFEGYTPAPAQPSKVFGPMGGSISGGPNPGTFTS